MREASRIVLKGFELKFDLKLIPYPKRYTDPRGAVMWATVCRILDKLQNRQLSAERASA
jgi:hypothetical protein